VLRDAALENDMIFHEYSHGLSTRLTGGPSKPGCLGYDEPGGLGEGWGDFFAVMLRLRPDHTRATVPAWAFGGWVTANPKRGLRFFSYSPDIKVHPETYAWLDRPNYLDVHNMGPIWTAALYDVYWNLRDRLPFTEDWMSVSLAHANTLILRLITFGMQLQPCRPTYVIARDAILQAERILTQGQYQCELWHGFARRGLGVGAQLRLDEDGLVDGRTESMQVPAECRTPPKR